MPTVRRKRFDRGRTDLLTDTLRAHLSCGCYYFDRSERDRFRDEDHRRQMWEAYRQEILADWDRPGRRPVALWEYDLGSWDRYGESQEDAVHALLRQGLLTPCRFHGTNRIGDEVAEIERAWRHEIHVAMIGHTAVLPPPEPPGWRGCPSWFWREHAAAIFAQLDAERRAWARDLGAEFRMGQGTT